MRINVNWQNIVIKFFTIIENSIIRIISRMFFSETEQEIKKVLVFTVGGLGDFIATVPAIKKIREIFPRAYIILLCCDSTMINISRRMPKNPEWYDFVDHLVDEKMFIKGVLIRNKKNIKTIRNYIKTQSPDATFILDPLGAGLINKLKKIVFLKMVGVKSNVFGKRVLFDFNMKILRNTYFTLGLIRNTIWGPLEAICEYNGQQIIDPEYSININENKVADYVKKLGSEKYIVIFPGGFFPFKLWPIEKYIDLLRRLVAENNELNVYLIGASSDSYECDVLVRLLNFSKLKNFCNKLNLMETAYLLKNAMLYIGNDSGPSHLSSALGTQSIILEHAQDYPGYWCPYGENVHPIRISIECQYCRTYPVCPTGTLDCIRKIKVEDVEAIAKKILN